MRDTGRLYKSYEQMVENLKSKEFQVIDARSPAMYSGEGKIALVCFDYGLMSQSPFFQSCRDAVLNVLLIRCQLFKINDIVT